MRAVLIGATGVVVQIALVCVSYLYYVRRTLPSQPLAGRSITVIAVTALITTLLIGTAIAALLPSQPPPPLRKQPETGH
jgi:hypothetical protein